MFWGSGVRRAPRSGVSELYASLLMIGITLSFGSVVTAVAMGQLGQSASSASLSSSLQARSAGRQISLVYAAVSSPGSCPSYQGAPEGNVLTITLVDYGSQTFAPVQILVNGTSYFSGSYQQLAPGAMLSYSTSLLPTGACAHPTGQAVLLTDLGGDEVQFVT